MKLVYLSGLVLLLTACAKLPDNPSAGTPDPVYHTRSISRDLYAADDSVRGVTCYQDKWSRSAPFCVKTFNPDSVR